VKRETAWNCINAMESKGCLVGPEYNVGNQKKNMDRKCNDISIPLFTKDEST
jgi:hypothetical protein